MLQVPGRCKNRSEPGLFASVDQHSTSFLCLKSLQNGVCHRISHPLTLQLFLPKDIFAHLSHLRTAELIKTEMLRSKNISCQLTTRGPDRTPLDVPLTTCGSCISSNFLNELNWTVKRDGSSANPFDVRRLFWKCWNSKPPHTRAVSSKISPRRVVSVDR